jgi:hypothetical protein
MPAALRIQDGTPVWASQAIVPSRDTVLSPGSSPAVAAIQVSSTDVFVYVRVENTGTVDLGVCTCSPVPAAWTPVVLFQGFHASPTQQTSQTQGGVTFTARPSTDASGDTLSGGGINFSFGVVSGNRRAWAWSADGRFFAHAASAFTAGSDWDLTVVALQDVTRSNGTVVRKGQAAVSGSSGLFAGAWNNGQFGWALSKAVVVAGAAAGTSGITRSVACPEAPGGATFGDLIPSFPGQVDWIHLVSPCGAVVAFVPKLLNATAPQQGIELVSTATAQRVQFRRNNAPTSVTIVGANPLITTTQHGANGVTINTGSGATTTVDDPDCTLVGGGVKVTVDRVKASTLPSANLGVAAVGTASLGVLRQGQSAWVQVPNTNASGWAHQSERHWCLLAQAYTADGTTIPRPWNGQAASPPAFPLSLQNCAQRNIEILP